MAKRAKSSGAGVHSETSTDASARTPKPLVAKGVVKKPTGPIATGRTSPGRSVKAAAKAPKSNGVSASPVAAEAAAAAEDKPAPETAKVPPQATIASITPPEPANSRDLEPQMAKPSMPEPQTPAAKIAALKVPGPQSPEPQFKGPQASKRATHQTGLSQPPTNFVAMGEEGIKAVLEANSALAEGFEKMGHEMVTCAQHALDRAVSLARALIETRTLSDVLSVQRSFAQRTLDELLANSARFSEIGLTATTNAIKPLGLRVQGAVQRIVPEF